MKFYDDVPDTCWILLIWKPISFRSGNFSSLILLMIFWLLFIVSLFQNYYCFSIGYCGFVFSCFSVTFFFFCCIFWDHKFYLLTLQLSLNFRYVFNSRERSFWKFWVFLFKEHSIIFFFNFCHCLLILWMLIFEEKGFFALLCFISLFGFYLPWAAAMAMPDP